jgi:hypothetical protein
MGKETRDEESVTAEKNGLDVFYEGSEDEERMIDGKGAMRAADQDRAGRIQPVNDWPTHPTQISAQNICASPAFWPSNNTKSSKNNIIHMFDLSRRPFLRSIT